MYDTISQKLHAISKYAPKYRYDHVVHIPKIHTHHKYRNMLLASQFEYLQNVKMWCLQTFRKYVHNYVGCSLPCQQLQIKHYCTLQSSSVFINYTEFNYLTLKITKYVLCSARQDTAARHCSIMSAWCCMMSVWCLFGVCLVSAWSCMMSVWCCMVCAWCCMWWQ